MNTQEILEFNRRCAEFLGLKYNTNQQYLLPLRQDWYGGNSYREWADSDTYTDDSIFEGYKENCWALCAAELEFHSNWSWIMEVVETIEKKSEHIIIGRPLYNSFDIGNRDIKFYFSPDNKYLLQLELKQNVPDEPWIHIMYKHHIIKQFDFKTKGKKAAVVEAINQFLIWYNHV